MPGILAYRAYRLFWQGLDWFYPPSCAGCGKYGVLWCDTCAQDIVPILLPICPRCGEPQQLGRRICRTCEDTTLHFVALRSYAQFQGKLRSAVHQLKYRRNVSLGYVLAQPMIKELSGLDWPVDLVTPVPLSLARMAERGYNQASLLARPIAIYFQKEYQPKVIRRNRETQSQVDLPMFARKENVAGAFTADRRLSAGKQVLVIDDVITTGSTLNACAKALMDAGAEAVYGYSLARGGIMKFHGPGNYL